MLQREPGSRKRRSSERRTKSLGCGILWEAQSIGPSIQGVGGIEKESDSGEAIRLIKEGPPPHFPDKKLVVDGKELMTTYNCTIRHTWGRATNLWIASQPWGGAKRANGYPPRATTGGSR